MKNLSIDIETYSDINLAHSGVYKYAEAETFEILLFAYSVDGGEVKVVDIARGEIISEKIIEAIVDDKVIKWAFNASFERVCLSYWLKRNYPQYFKSYSIEEDSLGNYLDPSSWRCSMVWSAYLGLPLSLKGVGAVLKLSDQKMEEGKSLVKYFCGPCRPTKKNGGRLRNLPHHDMVKWQQFVLYNKRDVEVELAIKERLRNFPVPDSVWEEYAIDQEINDRGILVDLDFVDSAIFMNKLSKDALNEALKGITHLSNPNSVIQMREWLLQNGLDVDSIGKKAIAELLKTAPPQLARVLILRQQLAKSSVRKYQVMQNVVCADGRARGMYQFYGASRSGRFAGRLIQLQNLPQNHMQELEAARDMVLDCNYKGLEALYDDIPDVLSQLIRTSFIPKYGYKFIVSDMAQIEARVLSYLAKEQWRLDAFASNKDIYCASASAMFHVPVEKHGINGELRQKGKIAELALGYGGSVGALKAMGALDMGLAEGELQPLVNSWRRANSNIVGYWWKIDEAVKLAVREGIASDVGCVHIYCKSRILFIRLPSGRTLSYVKPRMDVNQFGGDSVSYEGLNMVKKWDRIESYGPKFVENIVQAISRDILCEGMRNLRYCFIVGHVHDELIIECSKGVAVEEICRQMARTPSWLPGIILKADGYETKFYKKD